MTPKDPGRAQRRQKVFRRQPINWRVESILLAVMLLGSLVIRLYRLGDFPDTILGDEADTVQNAARILYGRTSLGDFFGLDWSQNPAFSVYKQAAFLGIFGFTSTAMRLPSALVSTLALVPFYFLLRRQVSPLPASLATVLLATELWYLNFSRSGWILIDIAFYMLLSMLLLVLAIDRATASRKTRRLGMILFGCAGLACCLGLYGYTAGRTISLAVLAFGLLILALKRKQARVLLAGFGILFGVEMLAFAPQAVTAARNWEHFNQRTGVVFIGNSPEFQADPARTIFQQLQRNILGPWDGRFNNTPQYTPVGEPQLSGFTGLLVLGGMLLTLALPRYRAQSETWLWWLMLLMGWVFTQLLTVNTPNGARGIGYMPALVYFAGPSLDWLARQVAELAQTRRRPWLGRSLAVALTTIFVVCAGAWSVFHYVSWQSKPETRLARYPYLTATEFPEWAADITARAVSGRGTTNLYIWRQDHPILDAANPYGSAP